MSEKMTEPSDIVINICSINDSHFVFMLALKVLVMAVDALGHY